MTNMMREMIKVYEEYYKCSNDRCASIYHIYNFYKDKFNCRDCGADSKIPQEAIDKKKANQDK